jgi:hypothetical protein
MQFVKGKAPETQYATRPGAGAKRREVALGRPGFEPGRIARMAEFKAIPGPVSAHFSRRRGMASKPCHSSHMHEFLHSLP